METLGKPHYVLNQDFYYWKNDKMNKVSKGQEYTWNGCAYSPREYDEKLNQGITIDKDFVEYGELFDKKHDDTSEIDFLDAIHSSNISRPIKEFIYKDYFDQQTSFKKQRDNDYEQLNHEDKEAFAYYKHAIDIFKKHNGYLTLTEECLIKKRGKEFLNIDESKFDKYKLMKEKDLALDFAIIFGIKPEEVPSKSSGTFEKNLKMLEKYKGVTEEIIDGREKYEAVREFLISPSEYASKKLDDLLNKDIETEATSQTIKQQVNELKKYSEMEQSKDGGLLRNLNDLAKSTGALPVDSEKEDIAEARDIAWEVQKKSISEGKEQTEEMPLKNYKVTFKDNRSPIYITENMLNDLMSTNERRNLSSCNCASDLLFASDDYTEEKIVLDSSFILSIVKVR